MYNTLKLINNRRLEDLQVTVILNVFYISNITGLPSFQYFSNKKVPILYYQIWVCYYSIVNY